MIDIVDKLNITTVGIIEKGKDRPIFNFIKQILLNEKYDICYENTNKNIIALKNKEKEIFIIDTNDKNIKSIEDIGMNFNVFIHNFIDLKGKNKKSLNKILKASEYIILNCDDDEWRSLIKDNMKSIIITYGFSSKATATVSSHSIDELIETNICFQRKINTIKGSIVDPLEIHIKIDSNRKNDIYSAMAALICVAMFDPNIILNNTTISL